MDQKEAIKRINQLRKEKDAVILAHYYVEDEVQELADIVGDSYYLAKQASQVTNENIIFCGVGFMGESAKILNPDKHVIMLDDHADCPMAHMITPEQILAVRKQYPKDLAVVCYVNSTAETKAVSDVCVTSSNALRVVKAIKEHYIFFVPDQNLGHYIAKLLPEKEFIFHDGFCHVHMDITPEEVLAAKEKHPDAEILTHPECKESVVKLSDFVGSTSEIIEYAGKSSSKEFLICTEVGVFYPLMKNNPDKKFYTVNGHQICPNMKKNTLQRLLRALETLEPEVIMEEEIAKGAETSLQRMLEFAAQ